MLWGPRGMRRCFGRSGGTGNYEALAINNAGYHCWVGCSPRAADDAVRWSPTGAATVLRGPRAAWSSEAVAENNVGQSIGYSATAKGDDAILWGPKGASPRCLRIQAAWASNSRSPSMAEGKASDMPRRGRRDRGGAVAAVGEGDEPRRLLGSDWSNTEAVGINNVGDIVGYGDYRNGTVSGTYGFLLTPSAATAVSAIPGSAAAAPEPSTWAMLVVGFAGLGFVGYRGARRREARGEVPMIWPLLVIGPIEPPLQMASPAGPSRAFQLSCNLLSIYWRSSPLWMEARMGVARGCRRHCPAVMMGDFDFKPRLSFEVREGPYLALPIRTAYDRFLALLARPKGRS